MQTEPWGGSRGGVEMSDKEEHCKYAINLLIISRHKYDTLKRGMWQSAVGNEKNDKKIFEHEYCW